MVDVEYAWEFQNCNMLLVDLHPAIIIVGKKTYSIVRIGYPSNEFEIKALVQKVPFSESKDEIRYLCDGR